MAASVTFPAFSSGSVWLVGAGPGDPGLLTLLARHALEEADIVLHDALVPADILALCSPRARLLSVGKRAGKASPKQLAISQRLVALAKAGHRVVRLKGGDPYVFGRGGEEALALAAAGVPFRVVPGITAGVGVTTYAGVPLTHRLMARSVTFVTGQEAGGDGDTVDWQGLAASSDTLVIYMGRRHLQGIIEQLLKGGRAPQEPVLIVGDGTQPGQQRVRTVLANAAADALSIQPDAAVLVIVGGAVLLGDLLAGWQETSPAVVLRDDVDQLLTRAGSVHP